MPAPVNSPGTQYSKAHSLESATDLTSIDLVAEGHKFRRRRRLTIIGIVLMFAVAGSFLVFSVVKQQISQKSIADHDCSAIDSECLENLCPHGYKWNTEMKQCELEEGD